MLIKQCFNIGVCGKKYREDNPEFEGGICTICGANLVIIDEGTEEENKYDSKVYSGKEEEIQVKGENECDVVKFKILPSGDIEILTSVEKVEDNEEGPRLLIYKGIELKEVYKIEYDEVTIGRKCVSETPDIDMTSYDRRKVTSRRHAIVYKYKDDFYVRNESAKNSLHVNIKAVAQGEERKLEDGDQIVLSRSYIIIFKM